MTKEQATSRNLVQVVLSNLATPWLIFVTSALPLYLANQEELNFNPYVMTHLLVIGAVVWAIWSIAWTFLRARRTGTYLIWVFYLAGPTFIAFVAIADSLTGLLEIIALTAAPAALIFTSFLLFRWIKPEQILAPLSFAALAFVAIDAQSYFQGQKTLPAAIANEATRASGSATLPNIYHVIFDEYQTEMFDLAIDEQTKTQLEGFIHYRENVTSFGRTGMALPAIFSGLNFDLSGKQIDYQYDAFNSPKSLLYDLKQLGYVTEAYLHPVYNFPLGLFDYSAYHKNKLSYGAKQLQETFMELWSYANLPDLVSKWLLGQELYDQYQNQNVLNPAAPILSRDVFRAVLDYESELPSRGRYVFIHLILPHFPNVLREDCTVNNNGNNTSPLAQSRCANRLMMELVAKLKSLDRFDHSFIIFQSDHGSRYAVEDNQLVGVEHMGYFSTEWNHARSRTLMLLKPPGATQSFSASNFPSTIVDTTPTILSNLGANTDAKDGIDLLSVNHDSKDRERYYHFFNKRGANGWTDKMTRFEITSNGIKKIGEISLTNNPPP